MPLIIKNPNFANIVKSACVLTIPSVQEVVTHVVVVYHVTIVMVSVMVTLACYLYIIVAYLICLRHKLD